MVIIKRMCECLNKFFRLSLIWLGRILFSPNHFNVPIYKRVFYAINGGFMADQIALYNLTLKNKKNYLSEFDWYKSRYINSPYNFVLNNKVVCSDILREYTKVPETYFIKIKGSIRTTLGLSVNEEIILNLLKEKKELILKPIDRGKGIGVLKLEYKNNRFYINGKLNSKNKINEILISENNWFISEYIHQSKELNKIFEDSANTIRLITIRNSKTLKCEVLFAVQRIGTKGTIPLDNGSQGALVSNINLITGELSEAKSIQKICNYERHPDTNAKIKGVKIKDWEYIKNHYVSIMDKLPYLDFIAWDILLTDKEPVVIEANTSSGVNIIQLWGGQRNDKLGQFYKSHDIIKK